MGEEFKAGRELDAEVARLIMGYVWATLNPRIYTTLSGKRFLVPPDSRDAAYRRCDTSLPKDELWYGDVPRYSTDTSAAMGVAVALMTRRKNAFWFYSEHEDKFGFFARFENFDSPEGGYSAWAATLEHAICRAALKAVGVATTASADSAPRQPDEGKRV